MEEPGRLQSMGLLESDMTERLHFHFSLSCVGEGNGNPLQCSCLENLRDGGAWWAAVSGVAQSRTQLKRLSSSSSSLWDLSSPTRDWTCASTVESKILTTRPLGASQDCTSHVLCLFACYLINFSWSIVALQHCVSFHCIANWISCIYTYSPSFWDFFPI